VRTKFQAEEEEAEEGDKAMAWSDLFGVQLLEKIQRGSFDSDSNSCCTWLRNLGGLNM